MEHLPVLKEIFSNKSEAVIVGIINLTVEANPCESSEIIFENIVNLLSETGDSTINNPEMQFHEGDLDYEDDSDFEEEGAVGYANQCASQEEINRYFERLKSVFPDINSAELMAKLHHYKYNLNYDVIVEDLTTNGYTIEPIDSTDIWNQLRDMLPDADPEYLREQAEILVQGTPDALRAFVENALEQKQYPSREDYVKRVKERIEFQKYTTNFNLNEYLEIVPNPIEKYSNSNRKLILVGDDVDPNDIKFVKEVLYNKYRFLRRKCIDMVFNPQVNLVQICNRLDRLPKSLRKPRDLVKESDSKNTELLQLMAYLKYGKLIRDTIKERDSLYKNAKEQARKFGLLEECKICGDDELIPEECFFCTKGCIYCKDCLKTGLEVAIGEGNLVFPCHYCDAVFSHGTLKMVLPTKTFEKLEGRIQSEELRKANLEGSDVCPFCNYIQLFEENDKIFKCKNPDCLMESCRLCRHKSHIPQRCEEIEYDEDVKMRTFIENKMAEAVMRTCHKCSKKFIKEHGCNKMTCSCGATICYLCNKGDIDYQHFQAGRCELYTENLTALHLENVRRGAREAKAQLGAKTFKFDPEKDIENLIQ
ncbi:uncharacterized protein LOC109600733 isoform X1 [Aethina tumida]|uniref:uncharacterized protein LOC109600733 isoform X1 n=1 Tax=Aethina tumida TaxID=116153 RepID=UPI00096B4CF2|nr:uncharacterized protein LOC109600733 isoform X1 [Aethina tumida]